MQYKFRGKRKDNGEWVFGDLWTNMTRPSDPLMRISTWVKDGDSYDNYEYTVIPETVGMWTGLKDKKSEDLYQGDIYESLHFPALRFVIMFISGAFVGGKNENVCSPIGWVDEDQSNQDWICKVGNIHDHPHLLTPAKGAVINTMNNLDPNNAQAAPANQEATEQTEQANAAESAARRTQR